MLSPSRTRRPSIPVKSNNYAKSLKNWAVFRAPSEAFHHHGHALAAADAQRGEAEALAARPQRVEERHQDAGAAGADRVTEGDGAAENVDLSRVEPEFAQDGEALGRAC